MERLGVPFSVAAPVGIALATLVGWLVEVWFYRRSATAARRRMCCS